MIASFFIFNNHQNFFKNLKAKIEKINKIAESESAITHKSLPKCKGTSGLKTNATRSDNQICSLVPQAIIKPNIHPFRKTTQQSNVKNPHSNSLPITPKISARICFHS